MKTLKDAIELILSQPPELHYPSYYADLLRKADVPDRNDGDTISRQAAINMCRKPHMRNADCSDFEMEIMMLPSVQPEVTEEAVKDYCRKRCLCIVDSALLKKYASAEPQERLVAKIDVSEEQIRDALEKIRNEPVHLIPSAHLLPSAELERKRGKWIVDALANNIWHCSECGTDAPVEPTGGTEYKSNYCHNCGADMREEQDED